MNCLLLPNTHNTHTNEVAFKQLHNIFSPVLGEYVCSLPKHSMQVQVKDLKLFVSCVY